MKKNGYTLIELIVTISLLATAATVVLINMIGMKGNQDLESVEKFNEEIESAACAYVDMIEQTELRSDCKTNSSLSECTISVKTLTNPLIELLDTGMKDPLTNCRLLKEEDKLSVRVWFKNNNGYKEKVCTLIRQDNMERCE